MTTIPADPPRVEELTDEEAEAMDRAEYPGLWATWDAYTYSQRKKKALWAVERFKMVRRAFAARPERFK